MDQLLNRAFRELELDGYHPLVLMFMVNCNWVFWIGKGAYMLLLQVQKGNERICEESGEAGRAALRPTVWEHWARAGVSEEGALREDNGPPYLWNKSEQLPSLPSAWTVQGASGSHRCGWDHLIVSRQPGGRPAAPQRWRMGGCAPDAPLDSYQPRWPAWGEASLASNILLAFSSHATLLLHC